MENTFDLKKFLVENKLTTNSRLLNENSVEGIDLDLVRALQKEPAIQTLQTQLKNNPELAKKAAKLVASVVDGKVSESINETFTPEEIKTAEEYGLSPEQIRFAKKYDIIRSKYSTDQTYVDLVIWANNTYNPAMKKRSYDNSPEPEKEDPKWLKKLKSTLGFFGLGSLFGAAVSAARVIASGGGPFSGVVADVPPEQLLATIIVAGLVTAGLSYGTELEENTGDLAGKVQAIIDAGREV